MLASFRAILALAACNGWEIESFGFTGAYLNGELGDDEVIYMQPPPGYETQGEGMVKRLHKSLYRLKQAGREWYDTLACALADLSFRVSLADPGVFHTKIKKHCLILAIHVDDCVLTGSSSELIACYKEKMNAHYALTDVGLIHWLLGLKITRDRDMRTISLPHESFIDSILVRFALIVLYFHACMVLVNSYQLSWFELGNNNNLLLSWCYLGGQKVSYWSWCDLGKKLISY